MIAGVDDLSLHHLYRAMAFLGEEVLDQDDATPFSPHCTDPECRHKSIPTTCEDAVKK